MTATPVSTLGLQLLSTYNLQNEQSLLGSLNAQLGSGVAHSNLTDYDPVQAQQLLNFQNAVTQRQSYISAATTVSTRLQVYDQTMTDMENIASQAQQLASQNPTQDTSKAGTIQQQIQSYMSQAVDDLNQQVGNRYVYAGNRYSTAPVSLSAVMNGTVTLPFTPVSANALPTYDSEYNASDPATATTSATYTANLPSGAANGATSPPSTLQVYDSVGNTHNMTLTWTKTATNSWKLSVDVAGGNTVGSTSSDYTATIPFTFNGSGSNAGEIKTGGIGSGSNYTVVDNSHPPAEVSFALNFPGAAAQTLTLNFGDYNSSTNSVTQFADPSGQVSVNSYTQNGNGGGVYDPKAWAQDSVTIDAGFNLQYGVTSTQTGFQQMIAGMQLINQATATGTSSATYQTDMTQASVLLNSALTNIQNYHAGVAAASNTITQEQTLQNTDIANLQNQVSNIQQVDVTQVGVELSTLQTQLQASYSATAAVIQLSILKYL
jgi:flagellin-like hook-associated protein FlgL